MLKTSSILFCAFAALFTISAHAADNPEAVELTLIHVNDLHSHFRAEKTALGLGGVARIKTAVDRMRRESPNSVFIDGGDWSDGNIYYNLGAGVESLKMMDWLGYDVAVVGNHDWLNGPDNLLDSYAKARSRVTLIAANVDVQHYRRQDEFLKDVLPYTIKEVGGVRIAFIGLVTYEYIYDSFFQPVKIKSPQRVLEELVSLLRTQVDAIVVVSHNKLKRNFELLKAIPEIDVMIGAHDHVLLTKPMVAKRPGAHDAWLVEAGCWGRFVGQVKMRVLPRRLAESRGVPSVQLLDYKLTQMDSTVPEDPATLARVSHLEKALEKQYATPIFHDHVADSDSELIREGTESLIGNFTADSYLNAIPEADFAVDQLDFIYGELHRGALSTADFINAYPAIYNPKTGRTWTLKTFRMSGRTLKWMLALLFASGKNIPVGDVGASSIVTSGLQFSYSPVVGTYVSGLDLADPPDQFHLLDPRLMESESPQWIIVHDIKVNGAPLDDNRQYRIAAGDGVLDALKFVNSILPGAISISGLKDSGVQLWDAMRSYARKLSLISFDKIPVGNRIRTDAPDLGLFSDEIEWHPTGSPVPIVGSPMTMLHAEILATITNFGKRASRDGDVKLLTNRNGVNETLAPDWQLSYEEKLPALQPGESVQVKLGGWVYGQRGLYPVTVSVEDVTAEINGSNNRITRWFELH